MLSKAFQIILGFGVISLFAAPLISGLRTGIIRSRTGRAIRRRKRPVVYWLNMLVLTTAVGFYLWVYVRFVTLVLAQ